jgi:hypothetical protein
MGTSAPLGALAKQQRRSAICLTPTLTAATNKTDTLATALELDTKDRMLVEYNDSEFEDSYTAGRPSGLLLGGQFIV